MRRLLKWLIQKHNERILLKNGCIHCANCKSLIDKTDKYCSYCGSTIFLAVSLMTSTRS